MVLQMTEIKGMEEQELLQMIIQMIRPPPFLCKWSFAKRTVLQMTKIKGTEEQAGVVANDHLDDPASSVLLPSFAKRTVLRMTYIFLVGWG